MDGIMQNTWFSKSSHQKLHRASDGAGGRDIPAEIKHRNVVAAWHESLKCIAHIHCILCAFVCLPPPWQIKLWAGLSPVCITRWIASSSSQKRVMFSIWKVILDMKKWSPRLGCLMSPSLPLLCCVSACPPVCLTSQSAALPPGALIE